jgi:hypothetical protein
MQWITAEITLQYPFIPPIRSLIQTRTRWLATGDMFWCKDHDPEAVPAAVPSSPPSLCFAPIVTRPLLRAPLPSLGPQPAG